MPTKLTQEEVIARFKEVHTDANGYCPYLYTKSKKYNYKGIDYINSTNKLEIYCLNCNKVFLQSYNLHYLQKCGHPKCKFKLNKNCKFPDKDKFCEKVELFVRDNLNNLTIDALAESLNCSAVVIRRLLNKYFLNYKEEYFQNYKTNKNLGKKRESSLEFIFFKLIEKIHGIEISKQWKFEKTLALKYTEASILEFFKDLYSQCKSGIIFFPSYIDSEIPIYTYSTLKRNIFKQTKMCWQTWIEKNFPEVSFDSYNLGTDSLVFKCLKVLINRYKNTYLKHLEFKYEFFIKDSMSRGCWRVDLKIVNKKTQEFCFFNSDGEYHKSCNETIKRDQNFERYCQKNGCKSYRFSTIGSSRKLYLTLIDMIQFLSIQESYLKEFKKIVPSQKEFGDILELLECYNHIEIKIKDYLKNNKVDLQQKYEEVGLGNLAKLIGVDFYKFKQYIEKTNIIELEVVGRKNNKIKNISSSLTKINLDELYPDNKKGNLSLLNDYKEKGGMLNLAKYLRIGPDRLKVFLENRGVLIKNLSEPVTRYETRKKQIKKANLKFPNNSIGNEKLKNSYIELALGGLSKSLGLSKEATKRLLKDRGIDKSLVELRLEKQIAKSLKKAHNFNGSVTEFENTHNKDYGVLYRNKLLSTINFPKKIRKTSSIKCINNGHVYASASEAARLLGLTTSCICKVLDLKQKETKGYKFKYVK